MTNHLRIHIADYKTVRHFLETEKLLLVVCNTHVDPEIGAHRKIISLPLGIKQRIQLFQRFTEILSRNFTKNKLLTINNSGWGDRTKINAIVSAAFKYTVKNSYRINMAYFDHYEETSRSKFMLCPSGLGMDSYRIWESLLLGTIPIVESNAGRPD